MKYTVLAIHFTQNTLVGSSGYLESSLKQAGKFGVALTANLLVFNTKEAAKVIHCLEDYFMKYGVPFVSIPTEGPISVGLKEDRYQEIDSLGIEIHKLVLEKQ